MKTQLFQPTANHAAMCSHSFPAAHDLPGGEFWPVYFCGHPDRANTLGSAPPLCRLILADLASFKPMPCSLWARHEGPGAVTEKKMT